MPEGQNLLEKFTHNYTCNTTIFPTLPCRVIIYSCL